jgi:asparagine synthase (glutamine-hydrolysing)
VYQRTIPAAARRWIASSIVPTLPGRVGHLARRSFLTVDRTPEANFFDNFAAIPLADQRLLLTRSIAAHASSASAYGPSVAFLRPDDRATPLLQRMLYTDVKTYLVELLMKQDQMSMAASIESRVPFLDHQLVEFAATLPPRWKLAGLTTKRVLREAARDLIPRSILERPKMGFPVPFGAWMRGPWMDAARSVLLDRRSRERGIVNARAIEDLLASHAAGRTNGADRIWSLLNLELWYRTFIDGGGIQSLPTPGSLGDSGVRRDPVSLARPA